MKQIGLMGGTRVGGGVENENDFGGSEPEFLTRRTQRARRGTEKDKGEGSAFAEAMADKERLGRRGGGFSAFASLRLGAYFLLASESPHSRRFASMSDGRFARL